MKVPNSFIILLIIFLSSCKSKRNPAASENEKNRQAYADTANTTRKDSLDTDTSSFIVTNFPDTVRQILYASNYKLFDYVLRAYDSLTNHDTLFSFETLKLNMLTDNFSVDSSENETVLWRHSFNRREQIGYSKNKKEIKILIANQLWYLRKKYQLVWIRILPDKKDETVFDNF